MTSTRGQNVSILQLHCTEPWDPPITTFTDTGGSLRSAPRSNPVRSEKGSFVNGEKFKQHSLENSLPGTLTKYPKRDFNSNKSISVVITNSINSSPGLSSTGRELSPVRWCDREVDGVYLGKSGWVQVQQRSLDENRRGGGEKNGAVSTLPSRMKLSNYHSNSEPDERKERPRPVYLPLPKEKHMSRENHKMPSSLVREFGSVSPPSVTPIISPPPAFKDPGLELEFQAYATRKNSTGKSPFLPRSKAIVDDESPPKSPTDEWSSINSLSHQFKKLTPSPVSSQHQQNHLTHMLQTKSLEDDASRRRDFNRYQDPASLFSHFGFRSLDSGTGRHTNSLRIHKTEYPSEIYDDREEDYGDYIRMSNSSLDRLSRERISPSAYRQRRNGRRTPSSDLSSFSKYSQRSSSLESSSSSSCERKSPSTSFRRSNTKQNRQLSENCFSLDSRNSKVRRSRSLQLSERRSPNGQMVITPVAGEPWNQVSPEYLQDKNEFNQQYAQSPQTDHRIMVTVNGESAVPSDKARWHSQKMVQLDGEKRDERLREAKEEARIISDFISGTRSRAAARNLLMHRYLNRPEDEEIAHKVRDIPSEPEYGVHFLGTNRRFRKKLQQQNEVNYSNGYPCTSNCDYWSLYSNREASAYPKPFPHLPSNSSTASSQSGNIKSSQSYPNQRKERDGKGGSTRSSPASLESMSDFDSKMKAQKLEGSSRMSSSPLIDRHHFPSQDLKAKKLQKQNSEKVRSRPEILSSGSFRLKVKQSVSLENNREKDRKSFASPYEESSSLSSSSSDICQPPSGGKNSKIQSLEVSSPLEDYSSSVGVREFKVPHEVFLSRPGSAPADEDHVAMDADQRSLSLPKSFMSDRHGFRHSNSFPWKRQFVEAASRNPETGQWQLPLEVPNTAPATPVRELVNAKDKDGLKKAQCTRSSSTPLLEEPLASNLEWTPPGVASERPDNYSGIIRNNSVPHKKIPPRIPVTSESVLQKFKKSFSLKFAKAKGNSKYDSEDSKNLTEGVSEEDLLLENSQIKSNAQNHKENDFVDQKFRFAPLGWTSSKERKRGKKEFRNARKNGIQIESRGNIDSSESHDTDHHDDIDSPPVIRRRATYGSDKSRPRSEVFNQILIDRLRADVQWRTQTRNYINGRRIRRTNSDLGDQRLLNRNVRNHCRTMMSTSSLNRPSRVNSVQPSPEGSVVFRNSKTYPRTQLRRSMSQPLGLNELFSLVSRRPSAMKSHTLSEDEQYPKGGQSEDELISDSDSSIASLSNRKKNFEVTSEEKAVILAEAVWDNVAMEPYELPFRAGDVIEVLDTCDQDWWWGATNENYGYFPSAFVRLRVSQEDTVEDCLAAMASGKKTSTKLRRGTSISLLSNDQVRSSVVRELINTERDLVKILGDVTEGFIVECRRRSDMFTPALVNTIFSNWEDLLAFQQKFLNDLEGRVDRESPYKSCVGETFLIHSSGFRMYSEYCNSHPMAIATLQELYQRNNYVKFFEACRLMRSLIEIPLDGYLLTPVQRICKYPLQLAELLKYTKPDHPDYEKVGKALEAMRGVATLINERKRKMESLEKLASWQQRVEGWEGEDLIEMSSQLIHQGEVIRITSGKWTSNITLFLFDHQIIYCKKDLLKRNTYVYKGRICLDTSEVIDLLDGKDPHLGVTIRHGLKIYSCLSDKWLIFCCRSSEEKIKWLEALREEKRIVIQDREGGLVLPAAAKHLARMAARSKRSPPSKPRGKNFKAELQYQRVDPRANRSDAGGRKIGRKVGTWFAFGGGIKNRRINPRSRSSPEHVP